MSTPRALVILAQGAEEMETVITVDVLRRAGIEVLLAGLEGAEPVVCSRKVRILPDCALEEASGDFDVLVLPGGAEGARRLCASAEVGRLLRAREAAGQLVAAICAAPAALKEHGAFAGRAMTCHPSVQEIVAVHGRLVSGTVVEDANLLTSPGPGATFAFALAIIRRLLDEDRVQKVREPMMFA